MAKPNYRITFSESDWTALHKPDHKDAAKIAASERDPKIRINAATRTVEIDDYPYGDFNNIHRAYKNAMRLPATGATQWMEQFGTAEFRKEEEEQIDKSRDALRDVDFPGQDPNDSLDLPEDCEALGGVEHTLLDAAGICLGHGHDQKAAYQFLADAVNNAEATFGPKGGMLFIEELPGYLQKEIDDYFAAADEPEWSDQAKEFFSTTTRARGLTDENKFETVLAQAKKKNVKIFAIDSGECSPSLAPPSAFGEMRTANMNAFAKEVMDKAIADNPDRKFVAFVGAKHSNTHEGGIPGLSQIYNIPAVAMTDDGTIKRDDEDRSLRGMPSKVEQLFVDRFLMDYDKEVKANRVPYAEETDPEAVKHMAVQLAAKLKASGKLKDDPALDRLRADTSPQGEKAYQEALEKLRQAVGTVSDGVPKGKRQRYEAAKTAITTGNADALDELLSLDPGVVLLRDEGGKTDGQNLLSRAGETGARVATSKLRGAMLAEIDRRTNSGEKLSEMNLAEAIIIKAENQAWDGDPSDTSHTVDVGQKKHKEMVAKLAADLKTKGVTKDNQAKIMKDLGTALATDGSFRKKEGRKLFGKRDPDHVSIDKKKAAKAWVKQLAAL